MKYPLLFLFLLFPLTLLTGSVNLSISDLTEALLRSEEANETALYIVWESRLPQALTAALAGCALAVSGLIMQTIFTNPLADPSLLGIHSGASLGAALAMLALGGWGSVGSFTLSGTLLTIVASFLGACGVIMLLLTFSRLLKGNLALLVTGVMLSFALSAVISLLSFYATADGVRSYIIWGLGDFSGVPLSRMSIFSAFILLPSLLIWMLARPLNALLLGSEYAYNLGVRVETVRTGLLGLTGLLTATVTAFCGPISFIGLAVPHIARLLLHTADHRKLIPATLLWGADIALLSLLLTHLPGERGVLPLAAITPLMGVPVVLYILTRRRAG